MKNGYIGPQKQDSGAIDLTRKTEKPNNLTKLFN